MFFKRVVRVTSDGQGRGLGPWQGPRELLWLILLALSGRPSLPFFPRPQPGAWSCYGNFRGTHFLSDIYGTESGLELRAAGKRSPPLSPVSLQALPSSQRPFLKDSAAPPSQWTASLQASEAPLALPPLPGRGGSTAWVVTQVV